MKGNLYFLAPQETAPYQKLVYVDASKVKGVDIIETKAGNRMFYLKIEGVEPVFIGWRNTPKEVRAIYEPHEDVKDLLFKLGAPHLLEREEWGAPWNNTEGVRYA